MASADVVARPDPRVIAVQTALDIHTDYPRPGLTYIDITGVLARPEAFQAAIDLIKAEYADTGVTHIAACEARGFLVAAPLALAMRLPMLPIRKKNKLPGDIISCEVQHSTFSSDRIEMRAGCISAGDKVLLVDDVIGTGKTLLGAAQLVGMMGGTVVGCACITELPGLRGCEKLAARGLHTFTVVPSIHLVEPAASVVAPTAAAGGSGAVSSGTVHATT